MKNKILIGMYGRCGTSLLVGILGRLGFRTGFNQDSFDRMQKKPARAGLEKGHNVDVILDDSLEVIKPFSEAHMIKHPEKTKEQCECFLFPVRGVSKAIASRQIVDEQGTTFNGGTHQGQITEDLAFNHMGRILDRAACLELPIKFMVFPKWVENFDYFYETLKPSFDVRGISREEVEEAYFDMVDLSKVHKL